MGNINIVNDFSYRRTKNDGGPGDNWWKSCKLPRNHVLNINICVFLYSDHLYKAHCIY